MQFYLIVSISYSNALQLTQYRNEKEKDNLASLKEQEQFHKRTQL